MDRKQQGSAAINPLLEMVAGGLRDPLNRLRFLKYTAPDPSAGPAEMAQPTGMRRLVRGALVSASLLAILPAMLTRTGASVKAAPSPPPVATALHQNWAGIPGEIWKIEDTGEFETYSNGLRIDNRFAIANHPRSYLVFAAGAARQRDGVRADKPAGIVFHTTESPQAPLEQREDRVLQRNERSLLEYVQHKRAYHFLIDRFGRVYRIVAERDAANHAGYSVWADETSVYLNLNESFLGVSLEAETQPGQVQSGVSPAQIRAAAMLTDMLRARYAIPASNCVTHAQVSVNPSNLRVGYHTDWASSFPYDQVGLPNNYSRPLAAIALFGFECDEHFLQGAGSAQYAGIEAAERVFRESARRSGMTAAAYRKVAQQRYREKLAATRHGLEEGG